MTEIKNAGAKLITAAVGKENEYFDLIGSLMNYNIKNFRQHPALVTGLCETPLCAVIAEICGKNIFDGTNLVIASDEKTCIKLVGILETFLENVYFFPEKDFVFYNISAFSHEWEYERIRVLRKVLENKAEIVVCTPKAALEILEPVHNIKGQIDIKYGGEMNLYELAAELCNFGYVRTDTVEGKGQFSNRGDILDIYPANSEYPVRIEFFGDEVDSIGYFDIMTQRRTENIKEITIMPAREVRLTQDEQQKCIESTQRLILQAEKRLEKAEKRSADKSEILLLKQTLEKLNSQKQQLTDGTFANTDKFLPILNPEKKCLADFAGAGIFLIDHYKIDESIKAYLWQLNENVTSLLQSGEIEPEYCTFANDRTYLYSKLEKLPSVIFDNFSSGFDFEISGLYQFSTKNTTPFVHGLDVLCEDLKNYMGSEYKSIIISQNVKTAENLNSLLLSNGIKSFIAQTHEVEKNIKAGQVYIVPGDGKVNKLCGFELVKSKIAFICENYENSAAKKKNSVYTSKKKKTAGQKILSYTDLNIGDYVVHSVHGIARYEGIKTLTVDNVTRDYITLQYAGSDVLYVPAGQLDKVSKYASGEANVKLSSMGSKDFMKAKSRAKKAAREMAKQLIELYAERQRIKGYAFSPDTEWQKDFEERFEYEETEGQLQAVSEIKGDMETSHPMDRLLCGDVGFGKTEVALRAIFKCVTDGKQAAVLVPTTILAWQHNQTILSRMKGFPVKVEMLSRFCKPKQAKEIIKRLETGETDIVIGTHKLLNKNIKFHDLGLLVIDEEQRFGVAHKERLKEMSQSVDVLTLSATPIPRTLNMAMAGIRDMSVLEEAPQNRYPVQTYVLEYDDLIICEAIKKELRRSGQVFYLFNKTEGIEEKAARLREEFPEAAISVAHGKMSQEELSEIWKSLVDGQTDILVCTTIIETGVDVPNANTLIIEDADRLGLSQLHQIRGRIGRSSRKAYAYITWKKSASLSEIATKRLEALREFTEFGSGYKIAMRDLEIRGAGNLLGAEQSGHMESIGYDLYIKILEQAVLSEKGVKTEEKKDCAIDLRMDAFIPEKYIKMPGARIEIYKKIAAVDSKEDADDVTDELQDRYGNIPKQVINLIDISYIRSCAEKRGIYKIEQRDGKIILYPLEIKNDITADITKHFMGKVLLTMGKMPCYNIKLSKNDNVKDVIFEIFDIIDKHCEGENL